MIDSPVQRESDVKETGDTMVIVEKVEKKVQVGKHSIFAQTSVLSLLRQVRP